MNIYPTRKKTELTCTYLEEVQVCKYKESAELGFL